MIPLCKNCIHKERSILTFFRIKDPDCNRTVTQEIDLVTGKMVKITPKRRCEIERIHIYFADTCGPQGKYFKER